MLFNELTTVQDVRAKDAGIEASTDDAGVFLPRIRAVSAFIAKTAGRQFVPRVETRYFDARRNVKDSAEIGTYLQLDDDLLSITTLTNGDSATITNSPTATYVTEPRNGSCFWAIHLLGSSGLSWTYNTDPENAITLAGIWGFDCSWVSGSPSEWRPLYAASDGVTPVTVNETLSSSDTGITVSAAPTWKAGQLWKIGTEFLYLASGATTTATVLRGVNGSTATSHANGDAIYVWTLDPALELLVRDAVAALYRLRNNPIAENYVSADGTTIVSPKDVYPYIEKRLVQMGLRRN